MTLRYPGEQTLSALIKDTERDAALQACLHHGPRRIYAGLLHHARRQKHKDGWAYFKFIDIFGTGPRPQDRGPPMPPTKALLTWISLLPKRSKKKSPATLELRGAQRGDKNAASRQRDL
jgi:hypothetical protein